MNNFKKTVMPGMLPCFTYGNKQEMKPVHIGVEFKDGKLSISGVVGAKSNGDCWGSCGQCIDSLVDPDFVTANKWTSDDVRKLFDIWERWHLNDMRTECEHQWELGWHGKAKRKATLYHWTITTEASRQKRAAKEAAVNALKVGETFIPTPEQIFFANLEYGVTTHTSTISGELATYYVPQKALYVGATGHTEEKILGWLTPEQHPDGLLSKPCPVCGYKRGNAWLKEEVPEDILQWLYNLPEAEKPCAWGSI